MTLLLREAIGGSLRRARTDRRRTLRDVAGRARVSLGYLSEVERGRKEASSELLAAICTALELPLSELLTEVADTMRPVPELPELLRPLVPIGTRHTELRRAAGPAGAAMVSVAA
ncbi:MAG: helix-turn-helix transcriptional regulator [Actinomycetota bacterium]|nr:helix-turn-helix transcriptional regulator [Actinomycetota bacterium]